ncbi:hypothetical protein [Sphingomonas panacis]|uniref:hypothetical protein n=1 Tax=Sphingomonas panacis TaxID=1560345 RepID=UPI000AE4D3F6|nr:hypothetical protein [Sphingomonas panacis]
MRQTVLACVLAASAVSATAQTEVPDAPDPYIHAQTGMRFPAQVGPFERHEVVRYNTDGSDTGVGYQLIQSGRKIGYVSMFVYPEPALGKDQSRQQACRDLFAGIKQDILKHEPDAKVLTEGDISAPSPHVRKRGLHATLSGGSAMFDGREQRVIEQASLFCHVGERWLVSYRVTWPEGENPTAAVEALVKALHWPEALSH